MTKDLATGKQRDYLAALGVELRASASSEEASRLIDEGKGNLKGPPSRSQIALAQRWHVDLSNAKNGYDAVESLFEHIRARRWVYSVCRRQAAAKWRYYSESGLDETIVDGIARWFAANSAFINDIGDRSVGDTATGDAWYRLTDAWCAKSEAYLTTSQQVHERFGSVMGQAKSGSRYSKKSVVRPAFGCGGKLLLVVAVVMLLITIVALLS